VFPDRPNGGRWIAFGYRYSENYRMPDEKRGKEQYGMSGERWVNIDEYLKGKNLVIRSVETSLYPYSKYDGFGYLNFSEMEIDLLKLFYLIDKQISPESVGFPPKMLKNMPLIEQRGFIKFQNSKSKLLIPHLTHEEYEEYRKIVSEAADKAVAKITAPMGEYINYKRKKIPLHLKSVPEQKLTMPYEVQAMCLVYEAINHNIHKRDLGYPCPETIVVFD